MDSGFTRACVGTSTDRWRTPCAYPVLFRDGPAGYCAMHAPRGATRIVPLTVLERLRFAIAYTRSLIRLALVVAAAVSLVLSVVVLAQSPLWSPVLRRLTDLFLRAHP